MKIDPSIMDYIICLFNADRYTICLEGVVDAASIII